MIKKIQIIYYVESLFANSFVVISLDYNMNIKKKKKIYRSW